MESKIKDLEKRYGRTCLILSLNDAERLIGEAFNVFGVQIHAELDGFWISADDDDSWCPDIDQIATALTSYIGAEVTSMHIDDCDDPGFWICYKKADQ